LMVLDHGYIAIVGIMGVVTVECVALCTGHDGQILLAVIAAISALAGASGGIAVKTWAQKKTGVIDDGETTEKDVEQDEE